MIKTITTIQEFDAVVNGPEKLVLIEFWSPQCAVCVKAESFLNDLLIAYTNLAIYKVDVDSLQQMIIKHSITKLPTFLLFCNKNEVSKITGFKNKLEIERAIRSYH